MLDRTITFGGDVIPAHVATTPHIIRPHRKITTTPIAGSNREVVEMEDAWEAYDQPYDFYIGNGSEDSIQEALNEVARIIYKTGWQVLVDEYEPDYFRLAYYQGGFDVENRYTRLGKFSLVFRCRPERYLASGNNPTAVSSGETITNPTAFAAKPLIKVEGTGSGSLTIQGQTISFTNLVDYIYVDCDKMDVYRQPAENRNNLMTGDFPVLKSGDNVITYTGGISGVTITPRFWVI